MNPQLVAKSRYRDVDLLNVNMGKPRNTCLTQAFLFIPATSLMLGSPCKYIYRLFGFLFCLFFSDALLFCCLLVKIIEAWSPLE